MAAMVNYTGGVYFRDYGERFSLFRLEDFKAVALCRVFTQMLHLDFLLPGDVWLEKHLCNFSIKMFRFKPCVVWHLGQICDRERALSHSRYELWSLSLSRDALRVKDGWDF